MVVLASELVPQNWFKISLINIFLKYSKMDDFFKLKNKLKMKFLEKKYCGTTSLARLYTGTAAEFLRFVERL